MPSVSAWPSSISFAEEWVEAASSPTVFSCTETTGKKTKERLGILNRSNDGFYIAEEDLKLRGPGDLFGIRQSGILDFKLGDIFQDAAILKEASDTAAFIMEKSDKFLSKDSPLFKKMMKSTHLEDGMLNL